MVVIYIYIYTRARARYMCVYLLTLLSQRNLTFYDILHASTIDIQVHKYIVIKQIFGLNFELDIQVNMQCIIV